MNDKNLSLFAGIKIKPIINSRRACTGLRVTADDTEKAQSFIKSFIISFNTGMAIIYINPKESKISLNNRIDGFARRLDILESDCKILKEMFSSISQLQITELKTNCLGFILRPKSLK